MVDGLSLYAYPAPASGSVLTPDARTVGLFSPLTNTDGSTYIVGYQYLDLVRLFVDTVNARPAMAGKPISVLLVDTKFTYDTAAEAATLFTQGLSSSLLGTVGDRYSSVTLPEATLTGVVRLPQVGYGSTTSALSDKARFPSFLRTIPSDRLHARAIAELVKYYNWDSVNTVNSNDAYGNGCMADFAAYAAELGITIATGPFTVTVNTPTAPELAALEDGLEAAGSPKVTVMCAHRPEAIAVLEHAKTAGLLVTGSAWVTGKDSFDFKAGVDTDARGDANVLGPVPKFFFTNPDSTAWTALEAAFLALTGTYEDGIEATGANGRIPPTNGPYLMDAIDTYARALAGGASAAYADRAALLTSMKERTFTGMTGTVSFDANGDRCGMAAAGGGDRAWFCWDARVWPRVGGAVA